MNILGLGETMTADEQTADEQDKSWICAGCGRTFTWGASTAEEDCCVDCTH